MAGVGGCALTLECAVSSQKNVSAADSRYTKWYATIEANKVFFLLLLFLENSLAT